MSSRPDSNVVAIAEENGSEGEVHERIIKLARERFMAIGFSAVSLDELAKDLRISKKTLYKYFKNKEEILRAVAQGIMKEASQRIDPVIQDTTLPVLAKLKALMAAVGLQASTVSQRVIQDIYHNAPNVWREIEAFRKKRIVTFGDLLSQGIEEGCFRKDINKEIFVAFYTNAMTSMVNPSNELIQRHAPRKIFDTIASVIFEGILVPEVREEFNKIKEEPLHP